MWRINTELEKHHMEEISVYREEQNREEGEKAQKKLGGGRIREKKKRNRLERREKLAQKVGRKKIYPLFPPPYRFLKRFSVCNGLC